MTKERVFNDKERAFLQARSILKVFNGVSLKEVMAWSDKRRQAWYEDAKAELEARRVKE